MTNLEYLIKRIISRSQPSTEDVFDTVKEYWDDVTKGYWNDVDDDLAEELGVTPVALQELLEVDRHTFHYANIGGNSSVRGYDHGEDWIVVEFSDGTRYLYTTKSTTPESIGYMKQLAFDGKGLNSYIMRLQRMNYAGRNVRGEILIRPGMESYNPDGYKRLKLIEAFSNTMTTQVSNESIIESVKKFLGLSNKGKGIEMTRKDKQLGHIKMAMQDLRYTFASPSWMDKQTYHTGKIKSDGIIEHLVNGDAEQTLRGSEVFLKAYAEWHKQVRTYLEKVDKEVKAGKDGKSIARPKYNKIKLPETGGTGELEALTQKQALRLGKEIMKQFMQLKESYRSDSGLISLPMPKGYDSQDEFFNAEGFKEQYEEYKKRTIAVLRYIDRSIKGKISVESISNEGIFDTIKRMFGGGKPEAKNAPAQPTPKQEIYVWDRAAAIEKSPPKELGSVSSESPIFQINGQYNPNWIVRLGNDLKQYSRITKELFAEDKKIAAWANKWDDKIDDFLGDVDRGDEFLQVVKAWVASQPQPWLNKFRNSYDFIGWGKGNWTTEKHNDGFGYKPWVTGNRVQIPDQNAMATAKVIKMIDELGKIILDTLEEDLTWVSYDFTDAPFRGYIYETPGVDDALVEMRYHADAFISPRNHYTVIEHRLEAILTSLVDYVEDAMKVSTGMEGHKQRTLERYEQQLKDAGDDGLEPTARRIMAVGLELFETAIKTSVESHDDGKVIPSNETLVSTVNKLGKSNKD